MSQELPAGTVTFLFTDIEGSTRLLRELGGRYASVLEEHRRILREACRRHGGVEMGAEGDACFFAFTTARAGLAAAVEGQQALASFRWPGESALLVRMGLHTGEAVRAGGSYVGLDVHRSARIAAVAHGGQVVLSDSTAALVAADLASGQGLIDLGVHRLKDFPHAQHLYQAAVPGLPRDFPPLRSLSDVPHNLPLHLTSFIGREQERQEARELLSRTRLLTFSGPGGAGKTRLAHHVAADVLGDFPDGVWLIELGPIVDPLLVPKAVASVLALREQPGRAIADVLGDAVRTRTMLLILDNCEHLVAAAACIVEHILRAGSRVKVIATSREVLGVAGEGVFAVPPLPYPPDDSAVSPARLAEYASVALFVDRARAAVPGFSLTPDNASAVAQICRSLDGIPLALELAAARARVLSPGEIAARLDDRFRLLTHGTRAPLSRQRTLQDVLDWSHDLLTESERTVLRRTAVFAGGFTLDAVESVCASGVSAQMLDVLTGLVDKSLVMTEPGSPASRYRLLETVRLYYRERLRDAGEEEEIRARHFDYFQRVVAPRERQDASARRDRAGLLAREHDNLRAALDWALSARPAAVLRMASGLWRFWAAYGHLAEGQRRLTSALSVASDAPDDIRTEALLGSGRLAALLGDLSGARDLIEQSRSTAERTGNALGVARATEELGNVAQRANEHAAARSWLEQALQLYRGVGRPENVGRVLSDLGHAYWHEGERALARSYSEESLAVAQSAGHAAIEALWTLGLLACDEGDLDGALVWYKRALALVVDAPARPDTAELLEACAGVAARRGDYVRAARLLAAAEALRDRNVTDSSRAGRPNW